MKEHINAFLSGNSIFKEAFFEDDDSASSDDADDIDYASSSNEDSYSSSSSSSSSRTTSYASERTPSYSNSSNRGDFMVIAGNYLVEGNASEMVDKLRSAGYNDAEKVVFDLSRFYTVIAGSYDTRSLANSISSELNGRGIENYVLRRKL